MNCTQIDTRISFCCQETEMSLSPPITKRVQQTNLCSTPLFAARVPLGSLALLFLSLVASFCSPQEGGPLPAATPIRGRRVLLRRRGDEGSRKSGGTAPSVTFPLRRQSCRGFGAAAEGAQGELASPLAVPSSPGAALGSAPPPLFLATTFLRGGPKGSKIHGRAGIRVPGLGGENEHQFHPGSREKICM